MNDIDQKLHQAIHTHMMSMNPDHIFSDRVYIFDDVENKLDIKIQGRVLDMGCGSGYASIWLAKNKPVEKVYAQEASRLAVDQLLPRNINYHGVAEKVEPLPGSFDAIPFNDFLDFVVSFGALHHSTCLYSTMRSIATALKDGGYLIAQEPVMPNTTSNQDYVDKYNIIENRFGLQIRNGDRNDNFFREAEYITAAAFSGLDLIFYDDYSKKTPFLLKMRTCIGRSAIKRYIKGLLSFFGLTQTKHADSTSVQHKYQKEVKPKIFVFRKNTTDYIPHVWQDLKSSDRK